MYIVENDGKFTINIRTFNGPEVAWTYCFPVTLVEAIEIATLGLAEEWMNSLGGLDKPLDSI
jgi:hypothetical protein